MHGRVKVRTTEEEKARKEKERAEKLKIYKHAMETIFRKRDEGKLDKDLLALTGKVLSSNPDIYTLWNIRREILIIFRKNDEYEGEMSQLYDAELHLTESCLKVNPKSYCTWFQREWVLTTRADPNWEKELTLCNMYLKLDERNFHTWDYRRFVVKQFKPSLKDEFDFTTEKLLENFSNYSAWHYRSKLLVELYPDVEGGRPIEDSHHKQELKMVLSAAFTDPDDTSAWFYQRWLLGAVKKVIRVAVYVLSPHESTVAFTQPTSMSFVSTNTRLFFNNNLVDGSWRSFSSNEYDVMWFFCPKADITEGLDVKLEFDSDDGKTQTIMGVKHNLNTYIGKGDISFEKKYSKPVIEELKKQLDSCRQLLAMEPDNKWTLLTTTTFLHCIDAKQYHKEVVENLYKLKTIDHYRAGYYDHLITKWSIEDQLIQDWQKDSLDFKIKFNHNMIIIPHTQYWSHYESVDLSNLGLTSKCLPSLEYLIHCKKLSLENNELTTLKDLPDLNLRELNIKGNNDLRKEEVDEFIKCSRYTVIF